ncbi:MAG: hypothetical protein HC886_02305 [Leptolyngbyaceae cyanobacterium SM1_1_3]|nr:hypothetical protein [Leptolyngbyaceae cyanobacterium SM1_1_3]NJN03552.1 hypothetical protein [Leptolyngbyaceae cyanobacterium RM1_1_2]
MLYLPYFAAADPGSADSPLRLANPKPPAGRERLRHLIMGSPDGVRSTINTLYMLNYADQGLWSEFVDIPASGIWLTPAQGEVFSYLLRYHRS